MKWPTMDEFAKSVAEKVLDEIEYNGKTLREWMEIILATDINVGTKDVPDINVGDMISRQAAINVCERVSNDKLHSADGNLGAEECREGIKKLPPIQPKRGHWIEADVCGGTTSWECSCCHNWTGLPTGWNVKAKLWFCPKCTADMREVTG